VAPSAEAAPNAEVAPPAEASPIPAVLLKIGAASAKYDSMMPKIWSIPYMPAGDTVFPDNPVRAELAKAHIWYTFSQLTEFAVNAKHLDQPPTPQTYVGEKPSYLVMSSIFATYNPSKTTQFVFFAHQMQENQKIWAGKNSTQIDSLMLTQTFLKDKLQLSVGWIPEQFTIVNSFTGGNFAAGTMGTNSIIPYEVGESRSLEVEPSFQVKYKSNNGFYNLATIQRSANPAGPDAEHDRNKIGLRFSEKGSGERALYIDEIGYQRNAAPNQKMRWLRLTGWYNPSRYSDLSSTTAMFTGKKTRVGAASAVFDQQLIQTDKYLPYRGWYVNFMGQYATPDANPYSQYYQVTLYSLGPFKSRPLDMFDVIYNRTQFSHDIMHTFRQIGTFTYDDNTMASAVYSFHLLGVYFSHGVSYIRHPQDYAQLGSTAKLGNPIVYNGQLAVRF
jgi:porin